MAIHDLYSKRQKILRGEVPEVYVYNNIPKQLKVQIIQIIEDSIGETKDYKDFPKAAYKLIRDTLCREYGVFHLIEKSTYKSIREELFKFFLETSDYEKTIDIIELCFKYIDRKIRKDYPDYTFHTTVRMSPEEAIEELNYRFKEHGVGYQYEISKIIRIDSTYAHAEIVKTTLTLLVNQKFKGANEEYLKAHEHYRHGRNKECIAECLKAFESTMKIICKEKGWNYNVNDTSKRLIQTCLDNDLIPSFSQNQLTSLRSLLETGIPPIRNRLGGHGQGQVPQKVNDEITRYALNLTGSNIIFLVEQSGIK